MENTAVAVGLNREMLEFMATMTTTMNSVLVRLDKIDNLLEKSDVNVKLALLEARNEAFQRLADDRYESVKKWIIAACSGGLSGVGSVIWNLV